MGRTIKAGESIFIPFINGESVANSQCEPRFYKSVEQLKKKYPGYDRERPEIVEYAPVVRCINCKHFISNDEVTQCGRCKCIDRDTFEDDGEVFEAVCYGEFCSHGERRTE